MHVERSSAVAGHPCNPVSTNGERRMSCAAISSSLWLGNTLSPRMQRVHVWSPWQWIGTCVHLAFAVNNFGAALWLFPWNHFLRLELIIMCATAAVLFSLIAFSVQVSISASQIRPAICSGLDWLMVRLVFYVQEMLTVYWLSMSMILWRSLDIESPSNVRLGCDQEPMSCSSES